MFLGGLIDLGLPVDYLKSEIAKMKIPFQFHAITTKKGSIQAVQIEIADPEESESHHVDHHHRPVAELIRIIQESKLSHSIREKSTTILWKIAQAEGKIHGQNPENVYLHEVGGVDTLIDITGVLIGVNYLAINKIMASIIPTGYGFISTSHGTLPIPAPATAELLKGIPVTAGHVPGELTTPTGAALIGTMAEQFGSIPPMIIERIGYGAGHRDYESPNVLRLLLGRDLPTSQHEENILIETNIDDMSPQIVDYVSEKLFEAGALDVYTTPIYMKKQRPAFMLSVIVPPSRLQEFRDLLFKETTTLGIREISFKKVSLPREDMELETTWGKTKVKISRYRDGIKLTPEYEECKSIARQFHLPLIEVIHAVRNAAENKLRTGGRFE